jgi:hypothetical protein
MIVQLEQHARGALERRGTAIEVELAAGCHCLERPQAHRHAGGQRAFAELDELVGTDDDLGQRAAQRLALAEAEQILRRQVEIGDDEIFIEGDDGNAETAEDALGAWCIAGRMARRSGRCG